MNHQDILVSVVMPCYNAEKFVADAIKSILNQTHKKIELIVVDDSSTDNSLKILNSFEDNRLKVISNVKNLGYPSSMNYGISKAKGKYIARMDADDLSSIDRIEKQLLLHEKFPNCAFVSSARCLLSPNGTAYSLASQKKENSFIEESWEDLLKGSRTFTDPASLILKENIDKVGGYQTYLRSGMDVDLWFRILENTKQNILVLEEFLYQRRLLPNAITFSVKTNNNLVMQRAAKRMNVDITKYITKEPNEKERLKLYIRFLSTISVHCFIVKDYKGGLSFFKKALSFKKNILSSVIFNTLKKIISYKKNNTIKIIHE